MRKKITIVKVGGAIVEDGEKLDELLARFSAIDGAKILVHGGGRRATKVAAALGIESRMVNGRRITDADMLEVVTMVYGGLVNKGVVACLQARGVNAVGLTGADMDIIRSHKRPPVTVAGMDGPVDFGYVGDVDRVDAHALEALLDHGATPVLAPLTHDGQGHMLNTNADTIASETAKALARDNDVTLVYSFEKRGVLARADDETSVIPAITRPDFDRLVASGVVAGGMIPKLQNALAAVDAGVSSVVITLASAIGTGQGTVIRKAGD